MPVAPAIVRSAVLTVTARPAPVMFSVSPLLGSPPLTVIPVRPVGRARVVHADRVLARAGVDRQRGLVGELDRLMLVDASPGHCQQRRAE